MEKNHMKSDALIELEFLTENKVNMHFHGDIEMLYVIQGEVDITVWEDTYHLKAEDMIVINASHHHCYKGTEDLLMGRFLISSVKVREMLNQNTVLFWCNSTLESHEAFRELRFIVNRIFNDSLKKDTGMIYRNSLYYQMLHVLSKHFLVSPGDIHYENSAAKSDDRLQEIFAYIRSNYYQNIRLQDLAEYLYLSETYVSKYIKKHCGINFVELVNAVRMEYAMEDLIHSNIPVIKIAMDNGFASVAAFNKCFKAAHQMSPSEFRKQMHMQIQKKGISKEEQKIREKIKQRVEAYLEEDPSYIEGGYISKKDITANAQNVQCIYEKEKLLGIINVGTMMDVLSSSLQTQILSSRERLGFSYVRFWNCFGAETNIDIHAPVEQQNFGRIDRVLDFLVMNHMKPYFELGYKPVRLLKNTSEAVWESTEDSQEFESDEEIRNFFQGYMKHLVRRYGADEVQTWYFEYHEQEELRFEELLFTYNPMPEHAHQNYFKRFHIIAETFRKLVPKVRIGGAGFPVQHYGKDGMRKILELWKQQKELPTFISVTGFPYRLETEGNIYFEKRTTDEDYIKNIINLTREAMAEVEFPVDELHLSEYGLSLSNRNVMNDSCYKGAFLVQNSISCMDKKNVLMGHWLFSDLYADYKDTYAILFGGAGLLNKNGIPKPGWYAFDFMNACYKNVIARDKNCLITCSESGEYAIVCHNLKSLNYNYYVEKENKISMADMQEMTENKEALTLRIRIKNVEKENYVIKRRRINEIYGSLQEEWKELNQETDLTVREIQHLQKITTTNLTMRHIDAENGCLEFEVVLRANEISSILISIR